MAETKILAIDPGPEQSAYVVWDGERVLDKGIAANSYVLNEVVAEGSCHIDAMVIEKIASYGMAVGAEVFETCVATGRFMERWAFRMGDTGIKRIPRLDVKVHLCKSAKAKDANVRQALIDRFGVPGTKAHPGPLYGVTSHCWAALAVAVTAFDRMRVGL